MVRLVRYFSVTSLIATVIVITVLGLLYHQMAVLSHIPMPSEATVTPVGGQVEFYSDVTAYLVAVHQLPQRLIIGVLTMLGLLLMANFLIIRYANRILKQQDQDNIQTTETLRQLNESLESQVVERTRELYQNGQLFRQVIASISDHIYVGEMSEAGEWKPIYTSPNVAVLTGYPYHVFENNWRAWESIIHPEDKAIALNNQGQAGENSEVEYRIQTLDKRMIWVRDSRQVSIETQPGESGRRITVYGVVSNITERKRAEAALIEEQALLARRVEERTADLSEANAELSRTARLKDEFLASMSHELRTPLNAILGMSEALQEQVYGSVNDRQLQTLASIAESGRHLLGLINDILDVAKIGAGKLELELTTVSLEQICQSSMRLIRSVAQKKNIMISSTFDSRVGIMRADGRRLKQILVNLLSNAAKFTPEGGAIGLEVEGDEAEGIVRFIVWDTGIGIAAEEMKQLFQPFMQLDSKLSRRYQGTGLGLSLVYRLTELHGGSVSLESEVSKGSRFTVCLPWDRRPIQDAGNDEDSLIQGEKFPFNVTQALVIEDSPTSADQLTRYLDGIGAKVVVHDRGGSVVEVALAVRPDIIILDILLTDISGWNVLSQLKADPRTCGVPVLIVSIEDERERGLALGAAEYLVKPISRRQFQWALARSFRPDLAIELSAEGQQTGAAPLVLLAEDNKDTIAFLTDYLLIKGYRVVVARNGREAIERAREKRPDLILTDIQMPEMDGLEATRRLRAAPAFKDVPILALTALDMPGDREQCFEAGVNEYLNKPVNLKHLSNLIQAYVLKT